MSSWQRSVLSTKTSTADGKNTQDRPETPGIAFARFFSQAMRLNVPFLPMTWDAGRDNIGSGATSSVNEALNLNLSLAFKRVDRRRPERQIYETLTREIAVLAHKSVRDHPKMVQLQGICWDLDDDDRPWPVLLFPKSHLGDLRKFMTLQEGRILDFDQRLSLCLDVGTALLDMHAIGIVHGDVKPGNVLVFPAPADTSSASRDQNTYEAKLMDFGFSTIFASQDDRLQLPISRPWNAPELDRPSREWAPSQAKLTDLYSFGLLCFWLLFEQRLLELPPPETPAVGSRGPVDPDAMLLHVKDRVQNLASQFVAAEQAAVLGSSLARVVCAFMISCLSTEPDQRLLGLEQFQEEIEKQGPRILDMEQRPAWLQDFQPSEALKRFYAEPNEVSGLKEMERVDFKLDGSMLNLYGSDYRVHKHIAESLLEAYGWDESCDIPLAFCYLSGFGIPRDVEKAQKILNKTEYSSDDVLIMLHDLNRRQTELPSVLARVTDDSGHADLGRVPDIYVEQGRLENALKVLERELKDLKEFSGPDNIPAADIQLRRQLVDIYDAQGQYVELQNLLLASLDKHSSSRKLETDDTNVQVHEVMSLLAADYRFLKRWEDAKEVETYLKNQAMPSETSQTHTHDKEEGITTPKTCPATGHPVEAFSQLALGALQPGQDRSVPGISTIPDDEPLLWLFERCASYIRHRKWRNINRVLTDTRRVCKSLISEHLVVLDTMNQLTKVNMTLGRYQVAEPWAKDAIQMGRQWGENHPSVLVGKGNLAMISLIMDKLDRAESLAKELIHIAQAKWGEDHDLTQYGWRILGSTYGQQGKMDEAEEVAKKLVAQNKKLYGDENMSTLDAVSNLAVIYHQQGDLDAAEELAEEALRTCVKMLGNRHARSLKRMDHLSMILFEQGETTAAAILGESCLQKRRDVLGSQHPDTASSMEAMAKIRSVQERQEEAMLLLEECLLARKSVYGEGHPHTLKVLCEMAKVRVRQCRFDDAISLLETCTDSQRRFLGLHHPDLMSSLSLLATIYQREGRHQSAIASTAEVIRISQQNYGANHPDTRRAIEYQKRLERQGQPRINP